MSCKRLSGLVAIVTGAAGGIGAATAKRLALEGACVVLADIDTASAKAVADEIGDRGDEACVQYLDLADEASIKNLYEFTQAGFGRLDILHNNAADTRLAQMQGDTTVSEIANDIWERAFAVNAKGTHLMLKHGLSKMLASGGGSIVNTSSTASITGSIFNPAYAASKASINSMTLSVAMQYGRAGIRCNAVLPGLIVTPSYQRSFTPELTKIIARQTSVPYLGLPDDIAAAVAFLASPDARFITGQLLVVDGGLLSHMPQSQDMLEYFEREALA